jgi:hypothetical protein
LPMSFQSLAAVADMPPVPRSLAATTPSGISADRLRVLVPDGGVSIISVRPHLWPYSRHL